LFFPQSDEASSGEVQRFLRQFPESLPVRRPDQNRFDFLSQHLSL
jgi:hypothetical protein